MQCLLQKEEEEEALLLHAIKILQTYTTTEQPSTERKSITFYVLVVLEAPKTLLNQPRVLNAGSTKVPLFFFVFPHVCPIKMCLVKIGHILGLPRHNRAL